MFEPEMVRFLESGCAIIVGIVGPDGEPYAARGWGIDVLTDGEARLRLLLDADDTVAVSWLTGGGPIAITGCDVRTLRSYQLKGRVLGLEPATDEDRHRSGRFRDLFYTDIMETDATPLELIERITPRDVCACLVVVDELFDQSPGPSAGASKVRSS